MNEFLYLMKAELMITVIIFILLFLKLGNKEIKNEIMLNFINILLVINLASGFFYVPDGKLFGEMIGSGIISMYRSFIFCFFQHCWECSL